jgi:CRISPR-associated protein Cas5h
MELIVFDLWGDFGHFRVPYTTSSPITFPVPPKTSLYGIIGAILGYDKESYLEKFKKNKWFFAVSLRSPVTKFHIPQNFINTKEVKMFARMPKGKSCRTQINMEFLKDPYFRIYVLSDNIIELKRFKTLVKEHKTAYTPVLGISECIANFKFIGSFDIKEEVGNEFIEINSILPLEDAIEIDFIQPGTKFLKIHMPTELNKNRELMESKDFIIEATARTITAKVKKYIHILELNENIIMI